MEQESKCCKILGGVGWVGAKSPIKWKSESLGSLSIPSPESSWECIYILQLSCVCRNRAKIICHELFFNLWIRWHVSNWSSQTYCNLTLWRKSSLRNSGFIEDWQGTYIFLRIVGSYFQLCFELEAEILENCLFVCLFDFSLQKWIGSKEYMSVYYENNRSELVKDASTCIAVPKKTVRFSSLEWIRLLYN